MLLLMHVPTNKSSPAYANGSSSGEVIWAVWVTQDEKVGPEKSSLYGNIEF